MKKIKLFAFLSISFLFISCGTVDIFELGNFIAETDETVSLISDSAKSIKKAADGISPEDEYIIGRTAAAIILDNYTLEESASKIKYINNICGALVLYSDRPYIYNGYKVALYKSTDLNALSTPGGHILISKSLYDMCDSEDMLAAIIAHELAHIQLGHSSQTIQTQRVMEAIGNTVEAVDAVDRKKNNKRALSKGEKVINEVAGQAVQTIVTNGFSKTQEFDADSYALKLLSDAGYDPKAMLELLNALKVKQNGNTSLDHTHPKPADRIKKLEAELKKPVYANVVSDRQARVARFNKYR